MYTNLSAIVGLLVGPDRFNNFWTGSGAGHRIISYKTHAQNGWTHFKVILSTPKATPSEISPAWIACAMLRIDCRPEEQSLFTVEMGTSAGIPAARAAARETYNGEGGWHVPRSTVNTNN